MKPVVQRMKIGIVGCGAIGSRIAEAVKMDLKKYCYVSAIYDIDVKKSEQLSERLRKKGICKSSLKILLKDSDFVIEAVNAETTRDIIHSALKLRKHVLAMSVGKLLNAQDLFTLAQRQRCFLLIPSGAIAGLDAMKAAGLQNITRITLTTRKPPLSFAHLRYFQEKGFDVNRIKRETTIFEGDVATAVKIFPQNINVAATIALASSAMERIVVRIITAPSYKSNSHEIEVLGDFGRMVTCTDNVVCPDNPKTSYIAVLSAIQTLKQFFSYVKIGT